MGRWPLSNSVDLAQHARGPGNEHGFFVCENIWWRLSATGCLQNSYHNKQEGLGRCPSQVGPASLKDPDLAGAQTEMHYTTMGMALYNGGGC